MSLSFSSQVSILYAVLWHYNRRGELQRLMCWAMHKQFEKPLRLYRARLQDEEIRLNHYQLHHPHLSAIAHALHRLNTICFPPPYYLRRGIAWGYTRRAMRQATRKG